MHRNHTWTERSHAPQLGAHPALARLLADPSVWKLSVMTCALAADELRRYREAFADFAASRGLQVHFSLGTTCIAPTDAPITSEDRGAVMGWLCTRPEVHFIHVRRRPPGTRSLVVACEPQASKPISQSGGQLLLLNREEDLSQDPESPFNAQENRHGN